MSENLKLDLIKMYVDATKAQTAQTELMLGEKFEGMKLLIQDPVKARQVKAHLDSTLGEGEEEIYKVLLEKSEEARVATEELHAKVLELRNKLFPESVS